MGILRKNIWGTTAALVATTVAAATYLSTMPPASGPTPVIASWPHASTPTQLARERNEWQPPSDVDSSLLEMAPGTNRTFSDILHLMLLFGPNADLIDHRAEGEPPDHIPLIAAATNDQKMLATLGGVSLQVSAHGVRYAHSSALPLDRSTTGEAHRDQAIAIFAQLGIPISSPIFIGGQKFSVKDVVVDSTSTFNLEQDELAWSTAAYCHYLPPQRSWKNKFGEVITFDGLAHELLNRPLNGKSCGGLHVVQALTTILRTHQTRFPILTGETERDIERYVQKHCDLALQTRLPSGAWAPDWYEDASHQSELPIAYKHDAFLITGHMLEWLLMLPDGDHLVPISSVNYILAFLDHNSVAEGQVPICPYTHAVLAVAGVSSFQCQE